MLLTDVYSPSHAAIRGQWTLVSPDLARIRALDSALPPEFPVLTPGTKVGPYEILGSLGAGGMGEVYRARDTRLARDVAIKVLPNSVAGDPDRLMRFEREAKTLAALNHPHIAQVFGMAETIDSADEARGIVMELVEGDTLADRLARGPIAVEDALPIARQIAAALEAAHDAGIIHRDLKPANIKVRPDGTVKVLDFGLAKGLAGDRTSADAGPSALHTVTSPAMTQAGVILGTAAYMAPEQAKGRAVDRRADVWAFGVVLYEMLTGRSAFPGETVVEVLGGVVKSPLDWTALPVDTPPAVHRVLRRCLEKDADRRLRDIREARLLLDTTGDDDRASAVTQDLPVRAPSLAIGLAVLSAALAVALVAMILRAPETPLREQITFEVSTTEPGNQYSVAISPDGLRVAWAAAGPTANVPLLWIRALDEIEARPLAGTEGAAHPAWSPDSRTLAYIGIANSLMTVDATGGAPRKLSGDAAGRPAWVSSAAILFSTSSTRLLHRISTAGGPAIRALEPEHGVVQNWPSMLPDGNHFLYLAAGSGARDELRVGSLETGTSKALMEATSMGVYAAGHVLFIRNRELLAQRLDEEALTLVGEPVPLVQGVAFNRANGRAAFDASRSGTLIYRSGANDLSWTMRWVDRQGKRVGALATAGMLVGPSLSPDGRRVAMTRLDGGGGDIWIENTSTGSQTNLTLDPTNQHWSPVWSPDGERVAYRARRGNSSALYAKMASGVGDAVLLSEQSIATSPMSWSPDGKHLLFMSIDPVTSWDIWVVSVVDGKAWPVANGPFNEGHPQFSPDGRWIAYSSNEFGDNQVFVQSFPPGRGKWQVAGVAGAFPRWRQDGGELLFLSGSFAVNAAVMSSAVAQVGDALQLAPARDVIRVGPLQTGPVVGVGNFLPWAISPDGQRFLVPQFEAGTAPERPQVTVVVNARALTNVR